MKKIYLAGKVAPNDWRHAVVPDLAYAMHEGNDWPEIDCDGFTYTGPYFMESSHGYVHGPTQHGALDPSTPIEHIRTQDRPRRMLLDQCLAAIRKSDVVFAWLDCLTAYGTLAEIGYARAFGKSIVVATPEPIATPHCACGHGCGGCSDGFLGELWFAYEMANARICYGDPASALRYVVSQLYPKPDPALALLESPIEKAFWTEHKRLNLPALADLAPQVPALGKYRLDFAIPKQKVAIELDGYEWHSSKDAFVKDRARQRDLEGAGWRVIRFAGSEIHADVTACVRQAAELAAR